MFAQKIAYRAVVALLSTALIGATVLIPAPPSSAAWIASASFANAGDAVAIDSTRGVLYSAQNLYNDRKIYKYDLTTNKIISGRVVLDEGFYAMEMEVDQETGDLFLLDDVNRLYKLTPGGIRTQLFGEWPNHGPNSINMAHFAYDSSTKRAYVAGSNNYIGVMAAIDTATGAELWRVNLPGDQPEQVTIDAIRQRIYIAEFGYGNVIAIDASTQHVEAFDSGGSYCPSGCGPQGVAVDTATGFVYVSHSYTPELPGNFVSVLDSGTVTAIIHTGGEVSDLAIDSSGRRLFVRGDETVIIDVNTNIVLSRIQTPTGGNEGQIAVDESRHIAVVSSGYLRSFILRDVPKTLTSAVPKISGTLRVGSIVTAAPGTWTAGTTHSYQWLSRGIPVQGATEPTFTIRPSDAGARLRVQVSGLKEGYSTKVVSSADSAAVASIPFTEAGIPAITGENRVGALLSATPGTWSPVASVAYSWSRNGILIAGATSQQYLLTASDVGKRISVTTTGSAIGYTTRSTASAITPAIVPGALVPTSVQLEGVPKVGVASRAATAPWGPGPVALTYQWRLDGKAITGATKSTYMPNGAAAGKQLTVTVTGNRTGYDSTSVTSAAAVVGLGDLVTELPLISGSVAATKTISARLSGWSIGTVFTYQWSRDHVEIPGATGATYVPTAHDFGHQLTVIVTGTLAGYASSSRSSAESPTVLDVFSAAPKPTISGTARVGKTLAVKSGRWTPTPSLEFQWMRDGRSIAGATGLTYKIQSADKGRRISVKVTGTAIEYLDTTVISSPTAKVR